MRCDLALHGAVEQSDATFRPIRDFAPLFDGIGPMAYPALQSAFDALYPPGLQWYWRADFVNELSDQAIALHAENGSRLPTAHSTMHLYPIDGAAHEVGKSETAFSYRDARYVRGDRRRRSRPGKQREDHCLDEGLLERLHPFSAGGAYVNFMMEEGHNRVKDSYRDNYDRLVEVKTKYDPTNLFRVNQNVRPANLLSKSMNQSALILYVKTGCPWCAIAQEYLDKHGYRYERVDVHAKTARLSTK